MGAASQCRWLVRVQARWIGGGELESEATRSNRWRRSVFLVFFFCGGSQRRLQMDRLAVER
jgi:hypothetical protein